MTLLRAGYIALLVSLFAACSEPVREPATPSSPEPLPRPSFERLEETARSHLETERARLETELAAAPRSAPLLGELGGLYLAYGFDAAAAEVFERAGRYDSASFRSIYLLGVSLQRARHLADASDAFDRALQIRTNDLPVLLRAGRVALELGDMEASRALYERALETAPDAAAAWFAVGTISLQEGDLDRAIEALQRTLELDPEATTAHSPLALALHRVGETDRAREHQKLAGKTRPYFVDPLFDELGKLFAGPRIHLAQGDRAMTSGRVESSIAHYRRAVELDPDNARAHHNLGAALGRSGEHQEGLDHLRRSVELDPELIDARFDLASALANLGRPEGALAIDPSRDAIRRVVALHLIQQGREHAAEELLLEAPSPSHILEATLARLRATANDPTVRDPEAALASARTLFAERSGPELGETVALALEATGRHDEAVHWLEELIHSAESAGVEDQLLEPLKRRLIELRRSD